MLVFALIAVGLGLVLGALSFFLPQETEGAPPRQTEAGPSPQPQAPAEDPPARDTPASSRPVVPFPRPALLRLTGMPLLASGLIGSTLHGLGRPFEVVLGLSLALGIPVGLACTLILNRTLAPRQ